MQSMRCSYSAKRIVQPQFTAWHCFLASALPLQTNYYFFDSNEGVCFIARDSDLPI